MKSLFRAGCWKCNPLFQLFNEIKEVNVNILSAMKTSNKYIFHTNYYLFHSFLRNRWKFMYNETTSSKFNFFLKKILGRKTGMQLTAKTLIFSSTLF